MLKFISNEPNENEYPCKSMNIYDDKIQNKKKTIRKKLSNHTIQRNRQKISVDYKNK